MEKIVVYIRQNKMTKEEYSEALKSPQWLSKRDRIKKMDNYKCVKCKSKKELQVHHTYYLIGRMPWQVPDECLITLCSVCHKKAHNGKDISTFMRKTPPKLKLIKSTKIQKKEQIKPKTKKNKPEKVKKLRFYKYIALKSETLKEVFNKKTARREISELCKTLSGVMKGFDDKNLAEQWLKQIK